MDYLIGKLLVNKSLDDLLIMYGGSMVQNQDSVLAISASHSR